MHSQTSLSRTMAWMLWIIASIFYAYQYVLRVMPSIMLTDIMERFQLDAGSFGQFSGIYYISYSLMHLPVGIFLDRYGPKRIMTLCILLTVVGLSPMVFATHWIYPIIGRFLIGLGSSAAILGTFKIIRMTFAEKRFARMLSLSVMIGLIGAIYGGAPVNYLCTTIGYQMVIYLFSAIGIGLAVATYWIIPHSPPSPRTPIRSDLKEVFSQSKVLWVCLFAGFMVGPLEGFADVWGSEFLKRVYGFEPSVATSLPSAIFIGMCFGAPLLSFIAEKLKSHLATIIGAGIAMTVGFTLLLFGQISPKFLGFNFAVIGICSAYQILAIYKASTFVREEIAGLTTAIANMIIMIFGYVFHSTIGGIVSMLGGPTGNHSLFYGVIVIPIGLSLGLIGFILLLFKKKSKKL